MQKLMDLFLGIMAALGGFLDVGEVVYTLQAGARFYYSLLWPILIGTIGIIVYGEMSGRVAAVTQKATFDLIRERMPFWAGTALLIVSSIIALLTCAAELGGVSFFLQIATGLPVRVSLVITTLILFVIVYSFRFEWLERLFGLMGLGCVTYVVVAIFAKPDWSAAAHGLLPIPHGIKGGSEAIVYAYFGAGLIGTLMMPYEIYFYSSGAIEDKWKPKDLPINAATAIVGFILGGVVSMALVVCGAEFFMQRHIFSQVVGSSLLPPSIQFGKLAMLAAMIGLIFSLGGAAVETALSVGYNVCQYFDFAWGKDKPVREVKLFTSCWAIVLILAFVIVMVSTSVINLVEYAVMSSLVILPLSYYPILRTAQDPNMMHEHKNHLLNNILGWAFMVIVSLVAIASMPLLFLSHSGMK